MNPVTLLVSTLAPLASFALAAPLPVSEGARIAATHTIAFGKPAAAVPTNGMPDGPLLGNGDLGVVQAGPPEALAFHIGKGDF
jgi:hypothetical protein